MSQDKTTEALAEQKLFEIAYAQGAYTALCAIDAGGPAATDDDGRSLLPAEPQAADWEWLQDFGEEHLYHGLGALDHDDAEEMFRDGYRDQMEEHLEETEDEEPQAPRPFGVRAWKYPLQIRFAPIRVPGGPEELRFLEAEDASGKSIRIGRWEEQDDGTALLILEEPTGKPL